jgi:hypothetical protein
MIRTLKQAVEFFSNLQQDKLLHFFYGALISFPLIVFFDNIGFLISLVIFAAKEVIYDKIVIKGKPDMMDFLYSALPAVMFLILKNYI